MQVEAVVFGLYETGLGVIRSLGRNGVKVIGIDYKKDYAWYSRYVKPLKCPHPVKEERKFIDWLILNFGQDNIKRPVFLTSDHYVMIFSKNRETLSKYFVFNLANHETLSKISNKYQQYLLAKEAGIGVPDTYSITNKDDLESIKEKLKYPVFLKGMDVNLWRSKISSSIKGYQLNNEQDLYEVASTLIEQDVPFIIQKIIKGPDTNHYKYCSYISKSGKVLVEFTLQKIRQSPIRFGIGSVVQSVYFEELVIIGRKLLKGIGYNSVSSVEFKLDEEDGKLKLIEINPRYWQQNLLTYYCKSNFAYVNYLDLIDEKVETSLTFKTGVKWVNLFLDFNSFLGYYKLKEISLVEWVKSLRGPKVYSTFNWHDIKPFLCKINWGLRVFKAPLYLVDKIRFR